MLLRTEHDNGVVSLQSPVLTEVGVLHGFSTRIGGLSPAPFDALNLAPPSKDSGKDANTNIAENFRRIRKALGLERRVRIESKQVHGADVWQPPIKPLPLHAAPCCDALVTDQPSHLLVCRTADCVPVLFATTDGRCVASAHAGWRGIVAGVLGQTVDALAKLAGCQPTDIVAAIGPCIGTEAFEVGPEVAEAFAKVGLSEHVHEQASWAKPHIDLQACAQQQLTEAGLATIDGHGFCTHRDQELFFSYRRDGARSGRLAALITPVGEAPPPARR